MEKYINEEYLKSSIMNQSRHLFIYGYDGTQRKQFLENMAREYPVVLDKNYPMGVYIKEYGLPKISRTDKDINNGKIAIISSRFLYLSIAIDILLKSKQTNDLDSLNERLKKLIETLNKYSMNKNYNPIADLDDLIKILTESKEFYKKCYIEYYGKGDESLSINDTPLPFIQIDMFVEQLKWALKNKSYFGIIIDKQEDIAITSTHAINNLVGGRINSNISMKIATEPDKWDSYVDSNGEFVQESHDYGIIELDDSLPKYLKRNREKRIQDY